MNCDRTFNQRKKLALIIVIAVLVYFIVHHTTQRKTPELPKPVVIVQQPQMREMADYVTQTGNTVAFNSVNLVARVEGYLDAIQFIDGSLVKKGDTLFIIEPEPYLQKLREAQATVAAKKASYTYAKAEYARQKNMYKENATSLNNVEKWRAQMEIAFADIAQAEANEKIAAINDSYTQVLAPFNGRIGRHLVDAGNLVGNGAATTLATIEQIEPIYVYFNLNELDLIKLRAAAKARGMKPSEINQIPVDVGMQNDTGFPYQGHLDFVNTGLNASTGSMEFRALLANKNYPLLPGMFVQVRIPITQPTPTLTVPDTAVQYDQIGAYVLVVDSNHQVVLKRVQTGSLDQGWRAIVKGLDAQDKIVVNGLQNAIPGTQVAIRTQTNSPQLIENKEK